MENIATIMQCLILLKASYPKMSFDQQSVAAYQMALADLDPQLLKTAVLKHIASSKWFPTIAELRGGVTELILEADGQLTAPEAWAEVIRQVHRVGHWGKPDLAPLVLQAVQAVGGWQVICRGENFAADRAQFLRAYDLLRSRQAEKMQQMPAVTEAQRELAQAREKVNAEAAGLLARMNGKERGG